MKKIEIFLPHLSFGSPSSSSSSQNHYSIQQTEENKKKNKVSGKKYIGMDQARMWIKQEEAREETLKVLCEFRNNMKK